jgi:tetratricopeptide (TPR) repeat protein
LGIVSAGNGEDALARQSLDRAFNLVSDADDPLLYGLLCSVQATTLALEEVAPLAERVEWFARAKTAFEQIGHRRFVARTLGNIGHQLLWDGQWQEALTVLQQALTLGQELQDRRSVANVLETLAELHAIQGQYERSQSYLAEALALVEDHDHFVELQVRLALARLQWQQGHLASARAEFEQVVAVANQTKAKQWHVVAQLHLAEIGIAERQWEAVKPPWKHSTMWGWSVSCGSSKAVWHSPDKTSRRRKNRWDKRARCLSSAGGAGG